MESLEGRIATLALHTFEDLSTKSKPRSQPDGLREWVPMSAVVLVHDANCASEQLTCVALATGCKCLGYSSLPRCRGQVLHDSHAEILALRGLNRFLLSEVSQLIHTESSFESRFLCTRSSPAAVESADSDESCFADTTKSLPFAIRSNISIHLFSTEAPCGDASMEILMSELGPDDSVPWKTPPVYNPATSEHPSPALSLQGRGFFSDLGIIRRKPSRADAEPTLSKSCTDKLSVKQVTSLLAFPTYHFIAITPNTYLSSLILPAAKYSHAGCTRAFSPTGRLSAVQNLKLQDGYMFHSFEVIALPEDFQPHFPFSKPALTPIVFPTPTPNPDRTPPSNQPKAKQTSKHKAKSKATNLSALYIHPKNPNTGPSINETLLSGVLQGHSFLSSLNPNKASSISRFRMLELAQELALKLLVLSSQAETMGPGLLKIAGTNSDLPVGVNRDMMAEWKGLVHAKMYRDAKGSAKSRQRRGVKEMVGRILPGGGDEGWVRNEGDDDWGLSPQKTGT